MIPAKKPVMPSLSSWYADGFRWIASLFNGAPDHLDPLAENHGGENSYLTPLFHSPEDYISDTRLRVHSRQF